jgi:lysyl-tRNA synthetase class II
MKNNCVKYVKNYIIEADDTMGKGKLIDEIFGENAKQLHTTNLYYRLSYRNVSFMQTSSQHPEHTERFELMVNGKELANAYSELNDPIDQRLVLKNNSNYRKKATMKPCLSTKIFYEH